MTARSKPAGSAGRQTWTIEAIRGLGATTDVETAAEIIGIGRSKAYLLARDDEFPVRLLRIGRRILVPVPGILALIGAGDLTEVDSAR